MTGSSSKLGPMRRIHFSEHWPMRVINASGYPLEYATAGAVGLDLRAVIGMPREIPPGGRWLFDTGISIELLPNHFAMVQPRSGLALNHGVIAATGVIDNDYRGVIKVCLFNHWRLEYTIKPGDKIAQLVIIPVTHVIVEEVEALTVTERGDKGFGSTGR